MQVNKRFQKLVDKMPGLLQRMAAQPLRTRDNLAGIPEKGIYVFYENNKPIYVGRSNRMKERIQEHSRPSSKHTSATFAFLLALNQFKEGGTRRGTPDNLTRKELEIIPKFNKFFLKEKSRVAEMKIRAVEMDNQIEQTLFEVYAAMALNTTYNDFKTH